MKAENTPMEKNMQRTWLFVKLSSDDELIYSYTIFIAKFNENLLILQWKM